jgi:hypothetical protein
LVSNPEVITLTSDVDFLTNIFSLIVVKWCLAELARVLQEAGALPMLLGLTVEASYVMFQFSDPTRYWR